MKRKLLGIAMAICFYFALVFIFEKFGEKSKTPYFLTQYDFSDISWLLGLIISFFVMVESKLKLEKIFSIQLFFVFLYNAIVVIPYLLFFGISVENAKFSFFNFCILSIPILIIFLSQFVTFSVITERLPYFKKGDNIVLMFVIITLATSFLNLIFNMPESASFGINNVYDRRLEARKIFATGTFGAYLNSFLMGSWLPVLFFWGVSAKKYIYVFISVIMCILFWIFYGVKSLIVYCALSVLVAILFRVKKAYFRYIINIIIFVNIGLIVVTIFELLIKGYSYVEDYLLRRLFYVTSYNSSIYLDMFNNWGSHQLMGLWGDASENLPASLYVGQIYLGKNGLNANTNTFLYYLIQGGWLGYIFSILGVFVVFSLLNDRRFKSDIGVFLGLVWSLLLLEQSFTTALLSSGVAGLIILFMFFCFGEDSNNQRGI